MTGALARLAWVATALGLVAGLLVLDASRGGPATPLSQCNLALSRADRPPADVLVVGSSRTGTAIDHVALADLLAASGRVERPTVERLAVARSPLRATTGLLETYLAERGRPSVVVFELSFLTERTIDRIEALGPVGTADDVLLRRDANLLRYRQLVSLPAATEASVEALGGRWHGALRSVVLRSGALAYQFGRRPGDWGGLDHCDVATWTRESTWPADFAFSWDGGVDGETAEVAIDRLRAELTAATDDGDDLAAAGPAPDRAAPIGLDRPDRAAELAVLDRAVSSAASSGAIVVLLPLPVAGTRTDPGDLATLGTRYRGRAEVYDLYADAGIDGGTGRDDTRYDGIWYDDAHLTPVAGQLTTAVLARHLLDGPLGRLAGGPLSDRTSG